jgi:hypothetical protein
LLIKTALLYYFLFSKQNTIEFYSLAFGSYWSHSNRQEEEEEEEEEN